MKTCGKRCNNLQRQSRHRFTLHVVAANGEKLELVGQGEVSITIGGVPRRHMVLVTKHLVYTRG